MPAVSIVIPTYNQPALLLETLATVFAQSFTDYEVIIINDGSTDDTLAKLEPLQQQQGPRLRVITQPNGGIGIARNRGLDEARGTYIALLDHDDLWMPEKLATQVLFMQRHPLCVACGTLFTHSNNPARSSAFRLEDVANADGIVERPFLSTALGHEVFLTCTLMIDRVRCAGVRYGTQRNSTEDISFYFGLLTRGQYGIAGNTILATYRVFEGNASKDPEYYYRGMRMLRQMQRDGAFDDLPPIHQQDMLLRLAQLGRVSTVTQLIAGRRMNGVRLYAQEFWNQLRLKRLRFLLIVPVLLLLPRKIAAHRA